MNTHELAFVMSFVTPNQQQRYLRFLANGKNRAKILDRLNHSPDFDFGLANVIPRETATSQTLVSYLREIGAPKTVHVLADSSKLDGSELSLESAIAFANSHPFGVVVSCIPGKLALFKPESPSEFYVLQKQ